MMSKHLLWALILALELLTLTLGTQDEVLEKTKRLEAFLNVDNDIDDDIKASSRSDFEKKKNKIALDELNNILDLENEYLDEEDDVVLWRAVVTSLAEWNYKKMLSKKNGREKRDKEPICYQNVGCFLNDGPYSHLSHPSSPEEIDTKFYLYTGVKEEPDLISYMNLTSIRASSFNSSHIIKVIIHGFGSSCRRVWAKEMRHALLTVDDPNVICVDWEKGASLPNYPRATSNTRLVGRQVAILVNKIHEIFGTNNSMVHLIGFSLGAHVSGYAGAELHNVSRITGLDPAGPMFENQDIEARLDKTDGAFVDVIHSNGESLIMGGLGAWAPMGHIDFYPNGGRMQKGCTNLFLGAVTDIIFSSTPGDGRSLCNHRRAYKFFTDSVVPKCLFPAFPCENYEKFLAGECFPCSDDKCGNMGYYANKSPGSGIMYLATREEEPFCANQFRVIVYSSYNYPEAVSRGKVEIAFMRDDEYPDIFYMTKGPDEELRSGGKMVRMVVAHPLQELPTKIRLIYTAYNGWLSSGLAYWSIDKLVITDSFGKNASYCKTGLVLPSGVSTTITLNQGDCIPVFYDVYAPNSDQIWKTADMNNKVVNLYGDVNIVDPKLQLLDPSTGRLLSMNSTHRFSDANNTASFYPYGPVPISVLQQHIPANIKVGTRKPLIPSLRFISSLQRHFRPKAKPGRHELQPPQLVRPVQEIPLDYKEQNHTFELYPLPRPNPQQLRPPHRGELVAPAFGPSQPQSMHTPQVANFHPPRVPQEVRPVETVYVQAPGESPFQKGTLQDYYINESPVNAEKMNGRREVTKYLGQEYLGYPESTSVRYVDQYYGPSENYAQNYDYEGEEGESYKGEVADYDIVKTDFKAEQPENDFTKGEFEYGETSLQQPQLPRELESSLLQQTENSVLFRQPVNLIFMPNGTSVYDDQLVSFTEREDILDDEFEYYDDEEYDEVPGAQLLNRDDQTVTKGENNTEKGTETAGNNQKLSKDTGLTLTEIKSVAKLTENLTDPKSVGTVTEKAPKTEVKTESSPLPKNFSLKTVEPNLPLVTNNVKRNINIQLNTTRVNLPSFYNASKPASDKLNLHSGNLSLPLNISTEQSLNSNISSVDLQITSRLQVGNPAPLTLNSEPSLKNTSVPNISSLATEQSLHLSNISGVDLTDRIASRLQADNPAPLALNSSSSHASSLKTTSVPNTGSLLTFSSVSGVHQNELQANISGLPRTGSLSSQNQTVKLPAELPKLSSNYEVSSRGTPVVPQNEFQVKAMDMLKTRNSSTHNEAASDVTKSELLSSNSTSKVSARASSSGNGTTTMSQNELHMPEKPNPSNKSETVDVSKLALLSSNLSVKTSSRMSSELPIVDKLPLGLKEERQPEMAESLIRASSNQSTTQHRRVKGLQLEKKDNPKPLPITIMASVELPTTAPSVADLPDSSSLIAQFVNLGQTESRRAKPKNTESSRVENPLLIGRTSWRNTTIRGRNLKNSNYTSNNIPETRRGEGTVAPPATTNLSTILSDASTAGVTTPAPTESASTPTTAAPSRSSVPPPARHAVTLLSSADGVSKVEVEKSFPENSITLIKFKAEDRVTERSRKPSKDPATVQRVPEVVMAVVPEMPQNQRAPDIVVPEIQVYRAPDTLIPTPEVSQHQRLPDTLVAPEMTQQRPSGIATPEFDRTVILSQAQDTGLSEQPLQSKPNPTSEFSNPFGIPMERLSERHRVSTIAAPFGVLKAGSSVPVSPTSLRNSAGKRARLVYKPSELRPQSQTDPRATFPPQLHYFPAEKQEEFVPAVKDDIERADYSKFRQVEDWAILPPGVRLSRFDEHQRHLIETAKLQTLSRDLMPPAEFEEHGSRRRSRLGSWIPNILSYINPFGPKQDEPDPKSSNGWMTYIWGQPGSPTIAQTPVSQQGRAVPVRRNFKVRNRVRTVDTGVPSLEYAAAA